MSPAAAVEFLRRGLVAIKDTAEITEKPRGGDNKLLTQGVVGFECWKSEAGMDPGRLWAYSLGFWSGQLPPLFAHSCKRVKVPHLYYRDSTQHPRVVLLTFNVSPAPFSLQRPVPWLRLGRGSFGLRLRRLPLAVG